MKRKRNNRKRQFLFFAMFLYVLLAIAFVFFSPRRTTPIPNPSELRVQAEEAELAQARRKWEAANIQDYRYTLPRYDCEIEIIVEDGVASIGADTCAYSHPDYLTIPELFAEIAQVNAARNCGYNGCRCDGHIFADATYDETYGYPLMMAVQITYLPTVTARPYGMPEPCNLIGTGGNFYTIENFEVLQGN